MKTMRVGDVVRSVKPVTVIRGLRSFTLEAGTRGEVREIVACDAGFVRFSGLDEDLFTMADDVEAVTPMMKTSKALETAEDRDARYAAVVAKVEDRGMLKQVRNGFNHYFGPNAAPEMDQVRKMVGALPHSDSPAILRRAEEAERTVKRLEEELKAARSVLRTELRLAVEELIEDREAGKTDAWTGRELWQAGRDARMW